MSIHLFSWARHGAGAGLSAGLWAAMTQLGEILPPLECNSQAKVLALFAYLAAGLSVAAAGLSWRSTAGAANARLVGASPFVARVSALACLIFAYTLVLQGSADLVLNACEH